MKHVRWLLLPLMIIVLAACGGNSDDDADRPTELVVVTNDPNITALESTINAQATLLADSDDNPDALEDSDTTVTPTPAAIAVGVVADVEAVILSEPDVNSEELGALPPDTSVNVVGESEEDRFGIIYYNIQYGELFGWVASTQLEVADTVPDTDVGEVAANTVVPSTPLPTNTPGPTNTPAPTATPTITPTPLPPGFPTPSAFSVSIVEQVFEQGRMIWFEPNRQIWVLIGDEIDPTTGTWECYNDQFLDGQPEFDPNLNPPEGTSTASAVPGAEPRQPIRGFGRIWRENTDVQEGLGWALIPETRHSTRYIYVPGGEIDDDEEYEEGPGTYFVDSLFQYTLAFEEDVFGATCGDGLAGTWEIQ